MSPALASQKQKLIRFNELRQKGVPFTRGYIRQLVKEGSFPAPVNLGPHTICWYEHEIDAWVANRNRVSYAPAVDERREAITKNPGNDLGRCRG